LEHSCEKIFPVKRRKEKTVINLIVFSLYWKVKKKLRYKNKKAPLNSISIQSDPLEIDKMFENK
jgi:hypothetical protein